MGTVFVIGEALVDLLPDGPVAGGAPFNVARSLAALVVPVHLISRIGTGDEDDHDGKRVLESARYFGLNEAGLQRDAVHATGAVSVHAQADHGHSFEIHDHAAWDFIDAELALAQCATLKPSMVYFGTLAQRHSTSRQAIRAVLDRTSALRYLDLNLRMPFAGREVVAESLARADWVKVNDEELNQVLAWFVPCAAHFETTNLVATRWADLVPALQSLMQQFSLQRIFITLGAQGWVTCNAQGQCDHTGPAAPLAELADTVGAGDAFSAMLLAATHFEKPLQIALPLAARYAAALCEQRGPMVHSKSFFASWRASLL